MPLRVLLTGANGFIGQHILASFLEAGHSVRAVVRTEAKASQLRSSFAAFAASGKLDFGLVPDMTAPDAFASALAASDPPFDTVVHSASPFNYQRATSNADFLNPAIEGTTTILKGIAAHAPTVRRVVLTSSMAAVVDFAAPKLTPPTPRVYTDKDWNPTEWADALTTTNKNTMYQASKKFAELAAWDFTRQQSQFELAVVLPPMVYGPLRDPSIIGSDAAAELNQSTHNVYEALLRPGLTAADPVPPTGLHLYADVRDVARAHLLAATTPAAAGNRFIVCGGSMTYQRMANIFRAEIAKRGEDAKVQVPRGQPELEGPGDGAFEADASKAREVLGLEFRSGEDTMKDLVAQLLDIRARDKRDQV